MKIPLHLLSLHAIDLVVINSFPNTNSGELVLPLFVNVTLRSTHTAGWSVVPER